MTIASTAKALEVYLANVPWEVCASVDETNHRSHPLPLFAAEALGNIGPDAKESVPALVKLLERELVGENDAAKNTLTGWAAAGALGMIGKSHKKGVEVLLKATSGSSASAAPRRLSLAVG